jgi:DNA-binding CsgD family transcriptional regulator
MGAEQTFSRCRGLRTLHGLNETEIAIVRALAEGKQSKEIALAIGRSRATVEFHIRALYAKLDAKSRAQLVARGYERRLFPNDSVQRAGTERSA